GRWRGGAGGAHGVLTDGSCRRPAPPCPRARTREPVDVPGGTFTVSHEPSTVGTSILPPSTASGIEIGTSSTTSLPSRRKYGCGSTRTVRNRSPPPGAWPARRGFLPPPKPRGAFQPNGRPSPA